MAHDPKSTEEWCVLGQGFQSQLNKELPQVGGAEFIPQARNVKGVGSSAGDSNIPYVPHKHTYLLGDIPVRYDGSSLVTEYLEPDESTL